MYGDSTALSIAIHQRILCPTPLVRTHTAPSKHLLHAVLQAIRKRILAWGARRTVDGDGYDACPPHAFASWRWRLTYFVRTELNFIVWGITYRRTHVRTYARTCILVHARDAFNEADLRTLHALNFPFLNGLLKANHRWPDFLFEMEMNTRDNEHQGALSFGVLRGKKKCVRLERARTVCYLRRRSICFVARPSYFVVARGLRMRTPNISTRENTKLGSDALLPPTRQQRNWERRLKIYLRNVNKIHR